MGGFSERERAAAAQTEKACRQRLAEIEEAFSKPHSDQVNRALSVEAHRVHRDLQYALFVLSDTGGAS